MKYRGEFYTPMFNFYAETEFGGDFQTEAIYRDPEVQCLIDSGGLEECFDDPEGIIEQIDAGTFQAEGFERGWAIWPSDPLFLQHQSVDRPGAAPLPPNGQNLLGTDDTKRDVLARVIYGFRLSILFTLIVTGAASLIGIFAGAIQGFFGGWLDLIFQRIIEIWSATPSLYVIIIMFAILGRSFWLLVALMILFSWTGLVGVVRAEFLRARNLEYVRACAGAGRGQHDHHVPPHAAQRHGRHADLHAVHRDGHDRRAGLAGFPWLRPAVLGPVAGGTDLAGETEPASPVAGLHRIFHLCHHAVAAGLHFRRRPRCV